MKLSKNITDELTTLNINNDEIIKDILCDIIYASAHWVLRITPSIKYINLDGESVEEKWYNCLKQGGFLSVIENDEDIYPRHKIYYTDLDKATTKMRKKYIDSMSWDEYFADSILQEACFGEIIYS